MRTGTEQREFGGYCGAVSSAEVNSPSPPISGGEAPT